MKINFFFSSCDNRQQAFATHLKNRKERKKKKKGERKRRRREEKKKKRLFYKEFLLFNSRASQKEGTKECLCNQLILFFIQLT